MMNEDEAISEFLGFYSDSSLNDDILLSESRFSGWIFNPFKARGWLLAGTVLFAFIMLFSISSMLSWSFSINALLILSYN